MAGTNIGAWLVVVLAPLLFAGSAALLRWGLRRPREKRWLRCPNCYYDMRGHVPGSSGGGGESGGGSGGGLAAPLFVCPECGHDAKVLSNLVVENPSCLWTIAPALVGLGVAVPCIFSAIGWLLEQPAVRTITQDGGSVACQAVPLCGIKGLGGNLLPTSPRVREIYFVAPNLPSKASLQRMSSLRHLRYVHVSGPGVTDTHLAGLARLRGLNVLALGSAQITDAGLAPLKQMSSLRWLDLSNTQITGAVLAHLDKLFRTTVNDPPIYQSELSHGMLRAVPIDHLISRTSLALSGTQVTDRGLKRLKQMKGLGSLRLFSTQVTDTGVAELQESLPRLWIFRAWVEIVHEGRVGVTHD